MSDMPLPNDAERGRNEADASVPSGDSLDVMLRAWHDRDRVTSVKGRDALLALLDESPVPAVDGSTRGRAGGAGQVHDPRDRAAAGDSGRRRAALRWVRIGGGVGVLALVASIALLVLRSDGPGAGARGGSRQEMAARRDMPVAAPADRLATSSVEIADAAAPAAMAGKMAGEQESLESRARKVLSPNLLQIALGEQSKRDQNGARFRSRADLDRGMIQIPVTLTLNRTDAPSVQLLKDNGLSNLVQVGRSNTFNADADENALLRLAQFDFLLSMVGRGEVGSMTGAAASPPAKSKSDGEADKSAAPAGPTPDTKP